VPHLAGGFSALVVGLYSLSELYRGAMARALARTDCIRYCVTSHLSAFLECSRELGARSALAAWSAALEDSMPAEWDLLGLRGSRGLGDRGRLRRHRNEVVD
jgi:hypothetical protein